MTRRRMSTPFTIVPVWVRDRILEAPPAERANALAVYLVLRSHADNETGEAFPSRKRVGEFIGKSSASVKRAYATLEEVGAIERLGQRPAAPGTFGTQTVWMPSDPPTGGHG